MVDPADGAAIAREARGADGVVILLSRRWPRQVLPDVDSTIAAALKEVAAAPARRVVLVSSTEVYEPTTHHPGLADEDRLPPCRTSNPIPRAWRRLEAMAGEVMADEQPLVTLRSPPIAGRHSREGDG
jgi:nucleoside-diphosphate-sugar epimerase